MSILSLTLVVDSHAMACSLVFSRINELLNLFEKISPCSKARGIVGKGSLSFSEGPESGCSFLHEREGKHNSFIIMVVDIFVNEEVELGVVDPGSGFLWVSIESRWLSQF